VGQNGLTALTDLRAGEVSLVTRGANMKKRFPIFKQERNMDEQSMTVLKSVLETEAETEATLEEVFKADKVSKKGLDAVRGALRILNGFKDELLADVMKKLAAMAGYPPPGKEDEEDMYPKPGMKEGKGKDKVAKSDELPPEVRAILEPIMKAQESQINALKEQVAKSDAALTKERDERELAVWVQKCEDELAFYPGKSSEDLGKMLYVLHKQDPKLAEEQFTSMKQASVTIEKSALLTDAGLKPTGTRTNVANGSAWETICKLADGIVQKSEDVAITKAKAMNLVLKGERGRELYAQYLNEHPAQTEPFKA
jgi:hypothetical protein